MSTKNNPSKLHPEILKMYNSPIYRRKIKKMVEIAKTFKLVQTGVVMGKLPNRAKLDKKNPSDSELESFARITSLSLISKLFTILLKLLKQVLIGAPFLVVTITQ